MGPRNRIVPALLAAVVLGVLIAVLAQGSSSPSSSSTAPASAFNTPSSSGFDGAALPSEQPAPPFTLTDQAGRTVSLADYRGRVTVLSFLYSDCGAACTVIAQQIRGALDELSAAVPVLLISANPAADTRSRVARFLSSVSLTGRVSYLTGPPSRLRRLWRAYGITPASAGRASFGRHASVLLIDPRGRMRVLFEQEQLTPESLAHDIRKLDGDPTHP